MSRLSLLATPRPIAPKDHASSDPLSAVLVAGDQLALRGMACMINHAGPISGMEVHDSIDAAMIGPVTTLVVVHTGTPGLTAAKVMDLVQRRQAAALIAAGTGSPDGLTALQAAGARGLLSGMEVPEVCAGMIRLALVGGSCWPAVLPITQDKSNRQPGIPDEAVRLTARQRDIAKELVRGNSNKAIADAVGITEGTVKIHLTSIFRVLGVSNRAMAVGRLLPLLGAAARTGGIPDQDGRQL